MSQEIILKVENLSKQYQLGVFGTRTLSGDVHRWWMTRVRGKEDPFSKVGMVNDRTSKEKTDFVWALKDINFEVKRGEVLGIIGKNGAGKSTLLKLLSRVTSPTTGRIRSKGRMASLLEVGTGFHPELTGLENIYLNGAILGMTKAEIKRKLDEIIDFSGCALYIDTPVKRYSSGMKVRLGFAVAAFLDPEILIVDEVLAVGDAEFQKKAIGKMKDVSREGDRTVLFVSHNMSSVRQLCSKSMVLANGKNVFHGATEDAVNYYRKQNQKVNIQSVFQKTSLEHKDVEVTCAEVLSQTGEVTSEFDISEEIIVKLVISCKQKVPGLYGYVAIVNQREELIIESGTFDVPPNQLENLGIGTNIFKLKIKPNILPVGKYTFYLSLASPQADGFTVDNPKDILAFSVDDNSTRRGANRRAKTSYLINWEPINV